MPAAVSAALLETPKSSSSSPDRDRRLKRALGLQSPARRVNVAQQLGAGFEYKGQHRGGDQAFDKTDRQMDRLHQRDEGTEGQLGDAGKRGLQHDGEGPELQRDHAADDRGGVRMMGRQIR